MIWKNILNEELYKKEPQTCRSSFAEISPFPSLSKTLNASRYSSSDSGSRNLSFIISTNSENSIVPFPSVSTFLITSSNSASVGFWPSERRTN